MRKTSGGGGEEMVVAEIQGLYGAFSFPEKLLQQIWLRGDFDTREVFLADGRRVEILHPGRWNLLGGPDFKGARIRIDDVVTNGDIELHLHAADWRAHGHAADPAYANVVLHVVLFPREERFSSGAGGREIPILVLLPMLHHDLEEYAADAAVERLANHPLTRAHEALSALSEDTLRAELRTCAVARWAQKAHYARVRIERLGWREACHQSALEILGYAANRAPMLAIATAHPLAQWTSRSATADSARFADEIFDRPNAAWRWHTQGVRPANHPRTRLRQYAEWTATISDWPERLVAVSSELPAFDAEFGSSSMPLATAAVRKRYAFQAIRRHLAAGICANVVSGSRLDTLICDGFWPLLAARVPTDSSKLASWWGHWFSGDVPAKWLALLRALNVMDGRGWPASHGLAQGLLGWLLAEEKKQNFGDSAEGRGT